jgi:hypothetical protein
MRKDTNLLYFLSRLHRRRSVEIPAQKPFASGGKQALVYRAGKLQFWLFLIAAMNFSFLSEKLFIFFKASSGEICSGVEDCILDFSFCFFFILITWLFPVNWYFQLLP